MDQVLLFLYALRRSLPRPKQCQDAIPHEGLDHVPLDGLHLTLVHIAFTDETSPQHIDDVATAARRGLNGVAPFRIVIGPLTGSRGAVRFTVAPWDSLFEIHSRLREAVTEVLPGQQPKTTASFRPHVGIAYSDRPQPARPIAETVSNLRRLSPVNVNVREVRLVELHRQDHAYLWGSRHVLPLPGVYERPAIGA